MSQRESLSVSASRSGVAALSCQSRVPQTAHKTQSTRRPLSAARDQTLVSPDKTVRPDRGTWRDMPNAEADWFWHSRQWHT